MLIENPDAFKTWLTSILEPLCEADPAALAKYVYALVKKDKPLDDLRDGMVDQLDVFLQSETKPFVELLFKTLETQEYLTPVSSAQSVLTISSTTVSSHSVASSLQQDDAIAGPPSPTDDKAEIRPPSRDRKTEKEDLELKSLAPRSHADKRESAAATKHRIVLNRTTKFVPATVPKEKPAYATEQTLVKVMPDLLEDSMNEPLPARNSRRDRKSDSDKEDRRRRLYRSRSRSWERSRRALPVPAAGRWRNRSPPLQTRYRRSRSGSPPPLRAPRYRNVSPPPPGVTDIEPPKNRSRSRSRERMSPLPATALRDRLDRVSRERDRDRSGRSDRPIRDRLDQRERIDRDRIIDQRERERIDRDNREQRLDRDRRVMRDPPGGADTPTQDSNPGDCAGQSRGTTTTLAGIFAPITKKRCRDFDEKGYCMRGDLCQFDHGLDPVVLEDATLSRVLALPITGIPPPRPIPGHLAEYNPLAPDIWTRGQHPPGHQLHHNNRFSAPPPPPPPPHHPSHPSHPNHPQHHLQMSRELIPIPTVRVEDLRPSIGQMGPKASNGQQNMSVRPPALPGSGAQFPGQNQGPLPINNYNRRVFVPGQNSQSRHISPKMQGGNCSLELKKVPRGLNDILHLNNHFSKFGKIVNIQVSFEGDPEAAIITFSSHTEANVAYKSTEAVLNNRFIKVFWHNTESKQENVPPGQRVPVKDGKLAMPNHHNNNNHGSHNKVLINKDNLKITNTALAEAKLLTQQKLQKQQVEEDTAAAAAAVSMEAVAPTSGEKDAAKMTNGGEASQKPENGTARQETANIEMAALVKKRGEGHVKIVRDLRRRTQLLLEKQLGQQKALIIRLEENTMTNQKDALLGTIKQMQGNIDKTRKDLAALTKQQHTEEFGVLESLNNLSLSTKSKYTSANSNSIVGTIVKKPRSKEEAQKEILDAELDLFTKQQEGQDVTELMRKVADLRRQQSVLRHSSTLASRRGGAPQRAATRAKFSKIAAMAKGGALYVNQSVDHRPRSLLISGYEGDEQTLVEQHFSQYGEIVRRVVDSKTPSLWIQYDTRKAAELASAKGKQFNDRTLTVTWMDPLKRQAPVPVAVLPSAVAGPSSEPGTSVSSAGAGTSSSDQPVQPPGVDTKPQPEGAASNIADESNSTIDDQEFEGGVELSEDILLQDDEEEDEEDRSWRR